MPSRLIQFMAACVLLGLSAAPSFAHTAIASTTPADGSVLERSPAAIEIRFSDAARLTSVVVLDETPSPRKLAFAPTGSAVAFKLDEPRLVPGRNEIQWKALARDGHVISGSLIIMIQAASAAKH